MEAVPASVETAATDGGCGMMTIMIEFSPPLRIFPKIERIGIMTRIIFMWWSLAVFRMSLNDMLFAFSQEGWDSCKRGDKRPAPGGAG